MVFSTLNQSFSFHSSPESFISSRLQDLALSDPDLLPSATGKKRIVVASILNRKVHIVSSYHLCRDLLHGSFLLSPTGRTPSNVTLAATKLVNGDGNRQDLDADSLVAGPAYDQLMSDFFPPPNLLLEDGPIHATHKQAWMDQLSTFPSDITPRIRKIAEEHISSLLRPDATEVDGKVDLYDKLKSLAWETSLGIFLNISPSSSPGEFSQIERLQETLLRGQFSLLPVSINARLWQSPRSKGIKARKELQVKLGEIIGRQKPSCPFLQRGNVTEDDAANHTLLFTSSLAVKALASLLTAFILNLFLWHDPAHHDPTEERDNNADGEKKRSTSLAELIRSQGDKHVRERMLRSILLETERLSPPVVGVMRRAQRGLALRSDNHPGAHPQSQTAASRNDKSARMNTPRPSTSSEHPVPSGHDIWLYLSGASRDPSVFGEDADLFRFDRYMSSSSTFFSPTPINTADYTADPPDSLPPGFAFSAGPKSCLGTELVRQIVLTVGEVMLESELEMEGQLGDRGVKGWLGWEGGVAAVWVAKGMKQLPVQRPREAVRVRVWRGGVVNF